MSAGLEYIHRYTLPRCIRRGVAGQIAALTVRNPDGTGPTLTSATLNLYAGSTLKLGPLVAAVTGPGEAQTTLAAVATSEPLSDKWLEVWDVVISGVTQQFTRPVFLVRYVVDPVIDDTDLIDLHSDLAALRDPDQTSFERQRVGAWVAVNKLLIQKGNRPQLIVDDWQLRDLHRFKALAIIFGDFATSVGDGRYSELSQSYAARAIEEFERLQLSYDFDQDGFVGDAEQRPGNPVTFLSVPWGADRW